MEMRHDAAPQVHGAHTRGCCARARGLEIKTIIIVDWHMRAPLLHPGFLAGR